MGMSKKDAIELLYESNHKLNEWYGMLNRVTSFFNSSPDNKEGQRYIAGVKDVFDGVLKELQDKPIPEEQNTSTNSLS